MTSTDTESRPEKKEKKGEKEKKEPSVATWVALASAVVAIIAALIAYKQVNVTSQQNIAAEQQQLLTMTTTIAQQLDGVWPSTSNGLVTLEDELNIEGQSAEGVISQLAGNGVTSIEYDEVARALTYGSETAQAIAYFQDAVKAPPHDLVVEQEALRAEGDLYYNMGQPANGHDYLMRSIQIVSGHLPVSENFKANGIAQSYLSDASYQLNISCRTAATDIMAAKNITSRAGGANTSNASSIAYDQAEYDRKCSKANLQTFNW